MKLIWLTDIHLNFLEMNKCLEFYQRLKDSEGEIILISGDIGESNSTPNLILEMAQEIGKSIYFVLGNHDYYHSDVKSVRGDMIKLMRDKNHNICYMPSTDYRYLDNQTCLVGIDGWADGRNGNFVNSHVRLNDHRLIRDLFVAGLSMELRQKLEQLADRDAEELHHSLTMANTGKIKKIIVLTHVPPFPEVCLYRGKQSDDDFLPFYSSKATGDVIMEFAKLYPKIDLLVLCGHTHGKAEWSPLKNLVVKCGEAHYGNPDIQEIIEI